MFCGKNSKIFYYNNYNNYCTKVFLMSSFFIENKYEVVKNVISKDLSKFIYTEMKMNEKLKCTLEKCEINSYKFGDPQCKNSYSSTNDIFSESLMLYLKKRIEKIVNKIY